MARAAFAGLRQEGHVVCVSGGGSGIGRETALTLADLGADVSILDRTEGAAEATAAQVSAAGRRALAVTGDAADEDAVAGWVAATVEQFGRLDAMVACAGILGDGGPVFATASSDFDAVMGVNVRGSFLALREAARVMRRRRSGSIVLLSSLDGLQAEVGMFAYCVSKGALLNMARAAALDLAREGVRVNAVCPGVTLTPLLEGRLATIPNGDEVLAAYARKHPIGRVLRPEDIAAAIAYLTAPVSSGVTGIALPVDGGLGATWDHFQTPSWVAEG
jgi:NAD(P)-dependent dehydrogenase (short-subunit alcohol dehydrogenase family)